MRHLLIVGRPGVGKTTLVKQLTQELRGCPIDGFFTEELREDGERLGFWLSSLDGRQALLAHRQLDSPHQVGAYRVNVKLLDEVVVGIIRRAMDHAQVLFIDEIGKMELCSEAFQQIVDEAFLRGPRIVATLSVQPLPFLDRLKRRHDIELIPLSTGNWKPVFEELRVRLKLLCDEAEPVRQLHEHADRICQMIVAAETPQIDIDIQQARLREETARLFPDKPHVYQVVFESRFRRLWQQARHG